MRALAYTALVLLSLVLAASAWADSDGYYCVGPDYIAYQFGFAAPPVAPHRLHVIRLGGVAGIAEPMVFELPQFQVGGMLCTERSVQLGAVDVIYTVQLDSAGRPLRYETTSLLKPRHTPPGFQSHNLASRSRPVEALTTERVPLMKGAAEHEFVLEIEPKVTSDRCVTEITTRVLELDTAGQLVRERLVFQGKGHKVNCYPSRAIDIPPQVSKAERAGYDAWNRIADSEPEWEGNIEGQVEWTLRNYGDFLKKYPRHKLAGEAMFKVATATWAKGGYPESFHIIITQGTWDDWEVKKRYLDQWFDTSGFGGGVGWPVTIKQDAKQAVRARGIFRKLVAKYPSAKSATIAKYYSAVILDHCLNDRRNALVEYQAFVDKHSDAAPFAEKAKRRIELLRGAQ
jgi:hypothetical protein